MTGDYLDYESDFFGELTDYYDEIEVNKSDAPQYYIESLIFKMKDMINEAHKNGTLNFYYRPPKED